MPQQKFVVKFDESTDLYLKELQGETPIWAGVEQAIEFDTLPQAQAVAAQIGSGPVGVPKPR